MESPRDRPSPSPPFAFSGPSTDLSQGRVRTHFLISILLILSVALLAVVAGRYVPHGPHPVLDGARASLDYATLESEYTRLVEADVYNLENHRGLLEAHFAVPKETRTRYHTTIRDDAPIEARYRRYIASGDARLHDIGLYGMGYSFALQHLGDQALAWFDQVGNRDLPYLNNSCGSVLLEAGREPARARAFFEKEIALKGNVAGAVRNLAELFWQQGDLSALESLSGDAQSSGYVPLHYRRYLELAERRFGSYLVTLAQSEAGNLTWMSSGASLLIALMFLGYIYFVDVFRKERVSLLATVFLMGVLSGVLVSVFYDVAGVYGRFEEAGSDLHDLFFFVFGVGLFEETAKILPVLFVVFVWKKWDESVDILVFAAASALGFACIENAGYFSRVAIGLIVGRALSSVVLHVCTTSFAAYGLFHRRYKPDANGPLWIAGCFGGAVLAHGLYDFFLSSSLELGMLSTLILVYAIIVFRNMMENALDQSEFFVKSTYKVSLGLYLYYGVLGIVLMQFAILTVRYGIDLSLVNMGLNVLKFYFICAMLIVGFGNLTLVKRQWNRLLPRKSDTT